MNVTQYPERDEIIEAFYKMRDIGVKAVSVDSEQYDWWHNVLTKDVVFYPRDNEFGMESKPQVNGIILNII